MSWLGLTYHLVNKHLTNQIATSQGHMVHEKQGLQSTTKSPRTHEQQMLEIKKKFAALKKRIKGKGNLKEALLQDIGEDFFPIPSATNKKTNDVCYALLNRDDVSFAFTDQTGKFPQKSSTGNQYVMVAYHFDANLIWGVPIKDRRGTTLMEAWDELHNTFKKAGVAPNTYVLDNEKSKDLLACFAEAEVDYQLVAPYSHRNNLAERAIQTFKHHFKAGLASVDPNFPLSLWDKLIPQANLTLNLMRSCRVNPKLSAYTYIFGEFHFSATPIAPPGTKIVAHISPDNRGSWELNGEVGWYIGPSLNHYRCVKCYFPRTRSTRDCDTVDFFPTTVPFPQVTVTDFLKQAASDISTILTQPPSTNIPTLKAGDPVRNALLDLSTQLQRIDQLPLDSTSKPTTPPLQASYPRVESSKKSPSLAASPRVDPSQTPPLLTASPRVVSSQTPPSLDTTPQAVSQRTSLKNTPSIQQKVQQHLNSPPTSTLLQHSKSTKNTRFNNKNAHRYPLRSHSSGTNYRHLAAQYLAAQQLFNNPFQHAGFHIFRPDGKKETMDSLLSGPNGTVWLRSLSNEWGRLASGNQYGVKGTETIQFIHQHEVPTDRDVTYATFVCDLRPLKEEVYRVRITVGGDRLSYNDDAGSPAANLLETKLIINSTISDASKGARFMTADIKDHFLATPMKKAEYMKVQYKYFPEDIRQRYNLDSKVTPSGHIYIKINRGMYGLKQAAILAYDHLRKSLAPYGYKPVVGTVGLWKHESRPTTFCVCVDDFGIKYWSEDDKQHLLHALRKNFKITTDLQGKNYCGLQLDWNYKLGYVDISMPEYVWKSLKRLQHKPSVYPQFSPHQHVPITYGKPSTRQYATAPDTSPLLPSNEIKHIQSITGSFLYYARALDSSMLPALNEIASSQAAPTVNTKAKCQRLMDYAATYPNMYIRYHASDMVLHVDSDAAYLVAPKARSRISGYFYLSDHPSKTPHPKLNGAILVECKTLRHVVASAAEAEIAGVFHNAQTSLPIRHILQVLNHPQPPTPLKTDNSTANGFVHNNIHQKRSKSWDMRYYWLRDKQTQELFKIFWEKGKSNHADYTTKHHPTKHHLHIRHTKQYVRDKYPVLPLK